MRLYSDWLHRCLVRIHDSDVLTEQRLPRVYKVVDRCKVWLRLIEAERWHKEDTGIDVERARGVISDL